MNQDNITLLQKHNLSVTAARLAILWAVRQHPHSDADMILKQARQKAGSLSKQAVYDNLHALTQKGIIRSIQPMGHSARYEPNEDDNHHHIVCRSCGHTADIHCEMGKAPCLDPSHTHGFAIDEAEVIFWGLCPSCQTNPVNQSNQTKK